MHSFSGGVMLRSVFTDMTAAYLDYADTGALACVCRQQVRRAQTMKAAMAESEQTSRRFAKKSPLRDLHTKIDRRGFRSGL